MKGREREGRSDKRIGRKSNEQFKQKRKSILIYIKVLEEKRTLRGKVKKER